MGYGCRVPKIPLAFVSSWMPATDITYIGSRRDLMENSVQQVEFHKKSTLTGSSYHYWRKHFPKSKFQIYLCGRQHSTFFYWFLCISFNERAVVLKFIFLPKIFFFLFYSLIRNEMFFFCSFLALNLIFYIQFSFSNIYTQTYGIRSKKKTKQQWNP